MGDRYEVYSYSGNRVGWVEFSSVHGTWSGYQHGGYCVVSDACSREEAEESVRESYSGIDITER